MNNFLSKPTIQKALRFSLAYMLFGLFAILGLEVIVNLHAAIFKISLMATTRIGVGNAFYVWGGFFLFAIYAVGIVPLEAVMNRAARSGRLLPVGVRIFAAELGLALLALILPVIAEWALLPG